jgi:hypothetical protein
MKFLLTMIASAAALAPLAGRADELSYTYFQVAYVGADIDGLDQKLDGYGLFGSVELTDQFFAFAGYSDVGTTISGYDVSEQDTEIGIGYAWSVMKKMDVVGRVAYVGANAELDGYDDVDESGYALGVGLRGRPADRLEIEGGVQYTDLGDVGDTTSFGLGVQWYLSPEFAIAASGSISDDVTTYGIGVRGTWGRK